MPLSTPIGFRFFNFSFAYLKRLQSSELLHIKMNPTSCSDHGLYRILYSNWLAHFYLLKKSAKGLHHFGLDCAMLEFLKYVFYSRAVIQRTNVDFPAFLEHGSAEEIAVCAHTNRELCSLLKISKLKYKNPKPVAVDDFLKASPMIPLSCRSNLAELLVQYFTLVTAWS